MRVAVIGSRNLSVENLGDYLPENTTEIVSGGAKGVDTCARDYALSHGIKITEYLPEYEKYGRAAPLKRNITIIQNADLVLAFWDGKSKGTKFVIDSCEKLGVEVRVVEVWGWKNLHVPKGTGDFLFNKLIILFSFHGDLLLLNQ